MKDDLKRFSDRLNKALDNFGAPPKNKGRQRLVAKIFEVSYETARKWLEGESFPKTLKIPLIAEQLHVNPGWLLYGKGNIHPLATTLIPPTVDASQWRKVPVLTWIEAIDLKEDYFDIDEPGRDWVWTECEVGPRSFGLKIMDDSMEPRFPINCLIITDPDYEVGHKNIVIVHFHETNNVNCRQILFDGNKKYLKCSNSDYYITLFEDDTMSLHGTVRQMRHHLT